MLCVVNVLLPVCSALSHKLLSVQVFLRRKEGATNPDYSDDAEAEAGPWIRKMWMRTQLVSIKSHIDAVGHNKHTYTLCGRRKTFLGVGLECMFLSIFFYSSMPAEIRAFLRLYLSVGGNLFFLQSSALISLHFPPAISRLTHMHIYKVDFNATFSVLFSHFCCNEPKTNDDEER